MAARRPRKTTSVPSTTPVAAPAAGDRAAAGNRAIAGNQAVAGHPAVPGTRPVAGFADLGVPAALVAALGRVGIDTPFPIQAATLPDALAGRDLLGRGRTGSGKTYAFAIPVLARLAAAPSASRRPSRPRALILAPTRELATQIEATIAPLAAELSLRTLTVFGGVSARPQVSALRAGVDILIACPGRLADHVSTGHAVLDAIEITVLDEADHMADLGFLPVVKRLLDRTPAGSQRLLFSATLDSGVDVLVRRYLRSPVTHSVDSAASPPAAMTHHVLRVRPDDRLPVLIDLAAAPGRALVFTRTKRGAKKLTSQLVASGVPAVELHGNLAQNVRTRNLAAFSSGHAGTLVATDIAARGIHVDDVALVIHADPPAEHKAYLHRSGRTARAGASGIVVTLMTDDQVADVRDLTRQAGINPTITPLRPGDSLLAELAPGERRFTAPAVLATPPATGGRGRAATGRTATTGGRRSATGGRGTGTGDRHAAAGDRHAAAGDRRAASGERRTATGASSSRGSGGRGGRGTGSSSGTGGSSGRSAGQGGAGGDTSHTPRSAAAFSAGSRVGTRRGR